MNCKDCRWWNPEFERVPHSWGQCRRHAPMMELRITTETRFGQGRWPNTTAEDQCGDFERLVTTRRERGPAMKTLARWVAVSMLLLMVVGQVYSLGHKEGWDVVVIGAIFISVLVAAVWYGFLNEE
jgi:hypothetical protein